MYNPYNITNTLQLTTENHHLLVEFSQHASFILYKDEHHKLHEKMYVEEFGATLFVILLCVWRLICDYGGLNDSKSSPKYLLWWLVLVRDYPTTTKFERHVTLMEPCHSNKHIDRIRKAIMNIKPYIIHFENCFKLDRGLMCKTYHNGVDFAIYNRPNCKKEQIKNIAHDKFPYDKQYYSHKKKGGGLQYGVTTCIQTGEIVDAVGPKPCGAWPDIKYIKNTFFRYYQMAKWWKQIRGIGM